jgi:hypothetical protein
MTVQDDSVALGYVDQRVQRLDHRGSSVGEKGVSLPQKMQDGPRILVWENS